MSHNAQVAADMLRVIVILGCVLQAYLTVKSANADEGLGTRVVAFGAFMVDIFIGGTEALKFGHDVGYWRLYVGTVGIYALNAGYWLRLREMQRSSDSHHGAPTHSL